MRIVNKFFILIIRFYQIAISPYLGSNCRFTPTCSQYAIECFKTFPFYKAMWYSMIRILKCNKFFPGGYDPVPHSRSSDEK